MFATAPQPKLNNERKQAIEELIYQIGYQELLDVAETYGGFEDAESVEEIREELLRIVIECCELDGGDSSTIQLPGMDWIGVITGGMSHGDSPTESFEAVATISRFDAVEDLLRHFAQEDYLASKTR